MMDFDKLSSADYEVFAERPEIIPTTYRKNKDGIFKIRTGKNADGSIKEVPEPLSYTSFELSKRFENKDTNEVFFEISFDNKKIKISASDLANKKGIVALAGYGVNTIESKAKDLCEYIMEYKKWNEIPLCEEFERFGWKPDNSFVLGKYKYTAKGKTQISIVNHNNRKEINAVHEQGTLTGWITAINSLMKYENQRMKIYMACAAPLLQPLRESNFSQVDHGETSLGKTITAKAAMSIFGHPEDLMLSGEATSYAIELTASAFCDVPVHLDDIQNMDSKVIEKILYMIANGVGKARGSKNGGLRETLRWHSIGFLTSERPIFQKNTFGGLGVRVFEACDGLGAEDQEAVKTYQEKIKNNYGVFAPVLIDYIIKNKNEILNIHKESMERIHAIADEIHDKESKNTIGRIGNSYAIILTAAKIFEKLYKEIGGQYKDPESIIINAFKKGIENTKGSYCERGLDHILSWITANESFFLQCGKREIVLTDTGAYPARYKILGDIYSDRYCIITSELQKELTSAGFDHGRLIQDFIKKGYLDTGKTEKHGTKTVKIEGKSTRVYSFIRGEIEEEVEE